MNERPFSTIKQIADELQMSASGVRALIRAKRLRAVRIPGTGRRRMIRIRREDLVAFLESAAVEIDGAGHERVALRAVR